MQRTKFGYYVSYDTTKRKKYSDKKRAEIARLKRLGLSIRQIATELDIPYGSIHYILKEFNLVYPIADKPSSYYLTRSEAKYLYDITDAQFDYVRTNHRKYTVKFNNVVFLHQDYIFDYIEDKKGYKDRYGKAVKPSSYYLTRAEANYLYDLTDAQFDYARTNHRQYTVKFNNVVFLHQDYIFDYIEDKKGYKDRYGKADTSKD